MNRLLTSLYEHLPHWAVEWLDVLLPALQVALIALAAWVITRVLRRLLRRVESAYGLPPRVTLLTRRLVGFVVWSGAVLWALERIGVSSAVLWTAFTGFATVGAVAFFAVWSVLSNLFCTLLIFTTRAFRPGDLVELIESGDKPGFKGRVIDINLVYTTIQEEPGPDGERTTMQLPNSLFFQRALRRWPG